MSFIKPDYNRDRMEGELDQEERETLYHSIIIANARSVLEIGTSNGGGSTYMISCALNNLSSIGASCSNDKSRILKTVDNNSDRHKNAINLYTKRDLSPLGEYVRFITSDSIEYLLSISGSKFDFIFIDGSDNEKINLREYELCKSMIDPGGYISFHDYGANKTLLSKPVIEKDGSMREVRRCNSLVVFKRIY